MKRFIMTLGLVALAACTVAEDRDGGQVEQVEQVATADVALYKNANIYTLDAEQPRAEAMVVEGERIRFIGSNEDALAMAGDGVVVRDLGGRFVMPGIVDSHIHPGLIALFSGDMDETDSTPPLPTTSKEELFEALREIAGAAAEGDESFLTLEVWDVAMFLPDGPNKADLDEIFPSRPVMLNDNSGHSNWLNSAALAAFGIDRDTPDLSPEISYFVRDDSGEPTGWIKEFALFSYLGDALVLPHEELTASIKRFLDHHSASGVTSLWDAGNLGMEEPIYQALAELDRAGELPIRYEASYHIWAPDQIDIAADELLALRSKYQGERLKFNSIKIHYDGVGEIGTAAMIDPYVTDPDARGGVLFDAERLSEFMLELDGKGIDLHLHVVGDRATREALDAVELARATKGGPLAIELTLCHLETVHVDDVGRFKALDVHANFTPHWFVRPSYFGEAGSILLGDARTAQSNMARSFVEAGANVTFSSDAVAMEEGYYRADPFVGIQMGVTRQDYAAGPDAPMMPPKTQRVSLAAMIAGYTLNGARQLGQEDEIGSLESGKLADFVVLDRDPFEVDTYAIHQIDPAAVVLGGAVVAGSLD